MKIYRTINGNETMIELTDAEIESAYRDRKKFYEKCDLVQGIGMATDLDYYDDQLIVEDAKEVEVGRRLLTGKQLKDLIEDKDFMDKSVDRFEHALDNVDTYNECYWEIAETVILEEIDRKVPKSAKELKREENWERYENIINEIRLSSLPYKTITEIIYKIVNEGVE